MKKYPNIHNVDTVLRIAKETEAQINGRWVVRRPVGFSSLQYRIRAAWLVFTGKADALVWPEEQ